LETLMSIFVPRKLICSPSSSLNTKPSIYTKNNNSTMYKKYSQDSKCKLDTKVRW
jgi:hypothetical protein